MTLVSETMFVRSMIIDFLTEVPHDSAEGEIPTENVMTNGCSLVDGSVLLKITKHMGLPHHLMAFQAQITGAKGMSLLNPTNDSPNSPPTIWIRSSQKKDIPLQTLLYLF